ncbi:hypothetical protein GCM10022393_40360 [Aquimarina addita]|uniref:Uncharacterized protein n=1 Tax=Aquimarina addita TaxID=870485 RepID=A0ABP6UWG4_9FLAO
MEVLETKAKLKMEQKINLIDGSFTPSEAADVINSLLQEKINFHKLQRLSLIEGNTDDECIYDSDRIAELIAEQNTAKEFFKKARLEGRKITMNSTINITIED